MCNFANRVLPFAWNSFDIFCFCHACTEFVRRAVRVLKLLRYQSTDVIVTCCFCYCFDGRKGLVYFDFVLPLRLL